MPARAFGWRGPPDAGVLKALRRAGAPAGDSVLAGVVAADSSDGTALLPAEPLDQFSLGSCVLNAVVQVIYGALVLAGIPAFIASRLALYYWARYQHGDQASDTGTWIGTGFDVAADLGLPAEDVYPYLIPFFADKPGPEVYRDAFDRRGKIGINYHRLTTTGANLVADMEKARTKGWLVAFGVPVSEAFVRDNPTGIIYPPSSRDKIAGNHAMVVAGHDHQGAWGKVRNSWGEWGEPGQGRGYCRFSYDYLARASDCWICLAAPGGAP